MEPNLVARRKDTSRRIGVSTRTLDRWEISGNFPKRVKLGARAVGYLNTEVEDWLRSRARKGDSP
jgi:prophage regulatory protein